MYHVDFIWKDLLIILVITLLIYCIGIFVKKQYRKHPWSWKFSYGINLAICSIISVQAYNHYHSDKSMSYLLFALSIILFIYTLLYGKKMMKK